MSGHQNRPRHGWRHDDSRDSSSPGSSSGAPMRTASFGKALQPPGPRDVRKRMTRGSHGLADLDLDIYASMNRKGWRYQISNPN